MVLVGREGTDKLNEIGQMLVPSCKLDQEDTLGLRDLCCSEMFSLKKQNKNKHARQRRART